MNEPKWDELVGVLREEIGNLANAANGKLKLALDAEQKIRAAYDDCKQQMKIRMARGRGSSWENQILDRHKVSAAICRSIVLVHPFGEISAGSLNDRASNEILALLVATRILMSFAAKEADDAGKSSLAAYFRSGPALPKTSDGEGFALHFYRALYWHWVGNKTVQPTIDTWMDPFQIAITFFLIELMSSMAALKA